MKRKILLAEVSDQLSMLRKISKPIKEFGASTSALATDMFDSMHAAKGVGLSAVQIGVPERMIVAEYTEAKSAVPKMVLVNPEITWSSKRQVLDEEGCLSFPNIYGMVRRPEKITYKALDPKGQIIEGKASGLLARIIQHEIDHLNGVLFIDLVEGDLYTYETQNDTKEI